MIKSQCRKNDVFQMPKDNGIGTLLKPNTENLTPDKRCGFGRATQEFRFKLTLDRNLVAFTSVDQ